MSKLTSPFFFGGFSLLSGVLVVLLDAPPWALIAIWTCGGWWIGVGMESRWGPLQSHTGDTE